MQEKITIEKISEEKFKIIWGDDLNSTVILPEQEMIDFITTLETALTKMSSPKRLVKTEQIAISKINNTHRIWSYKNKMIQIEWGNLIKKIDLDTLKKAYKIFKKTKDELLEKLRKEKEIFDKKMKIIKNYFISGLVSLGFSICSTGIFLAFIFFVREYALEAFAVTLLCWTFFIVFYFLQQKNVKALIEFSADNAADTILPMLSSIPNNRKIVEMMTILFIVFTFMSIYFSKTIPKILNFYGNPAGIQNITD